jgi:hypothetical protein
MRNRVAALGVLVVLLLGPFPATLAEAQPVSLPHISIGMDSAQGPEGLGLSL